MKWGHIVSYSPTLGIMAQITSAADRRPLGPGEVYIGPAPPLAPRSLRQRLLGALRLNYARIMAWCWPFRARVIRPIQRFLASEGLEPATGDDSNPR